MEKTKGEVLTLAAAAQRAKVSWNIMRDALNAGELPETAMPRVPGRRGPTARGVSCRDLDAWSEARNQRHAPPLPPHLREVAVSVQVACRLVGYSKQHVLKEIYEGNLRASSLNLAEDRRADWQVRLGDLANWYARPERWYRRAAPRQFDAGILAQLEARMNGDEPPGNESGPTR